MADLPDSSASLYTILQMVSITAFEKMPLDQLLNIDDPQNHKRHSDNQLNLFDN